MNCSALAPWHPGERRTRTCNHAAATTALPPQGWFDLKNNTSVYVNGLPFDTDEKEVVAVFSKCGLIKEGPDGQPRVKLYRWVCWGLAGALSIKVAAWWASWAVRGSRCAVFMQCCVRPGPRSHPPTSPSPPPRNKETGELKGDALVTFFKAPSVQLATTLLDGAPLRDGGKPMSVSE